MYAIYERSDYDQEISRIDSSRMVEDLSLIITELEQIIIKLFSQLNNSNYDIGSDLETIYSFLEGINNVLLFGNVHKSSISDHAGPNVCIDALLTKYNCTRSMLIQIVRVIHEYYSNEMIIDYANVPRKINDILGEMRSYLCNRLIDNVTKLTNQDDKRSQQ